MNKKIRLTYLVLLLTLYFSCVEKKSTKEETKTSELVSTSKTDTLKFTSGIRAIFQDSKGNYWFGSHNEGVSRYDGNSFEYFTIKDGLSDNQVRSIQEDKKGNIWFGTANGINSYDGKSIKKYTLNENSAANWTKKDNDLWFNAGPQQGVYSYDGQKVSYLAFPTPRTIGTGNIYAVTGISKGKNNMLWFGTFGGVFGYDGNEFTIINDETLGLNEASNKLHVRSIFEDSKGRLWIGNNGIGVILKSGDSIVNFSKKQGKLLPMNEFEANIKTAQFTKNTGLQVVFAIAEDGEGNIWLADRDSGVWKYNGESLTNFKIDEKLKSQMIWDIYLDKNKDLLFGMAHGGVYKLKGEKFVKQF